MKMQLEDLMDLYIGEDAAELGDRLPPLPEIGQTRRKPSAPIKKRSHIRSVLGLAASVLIVLGVAGALFLGLGNGKTGGTTLSPGETQPTASPWGIVPSEEPDPAPEADDGSKQEAEQSSIDMQQDENSVDYLRIEGASVDYAYRCQGNLFFDGNQYYTLRDGQIVQTEVQSLHIDFYAYGDWDLFIDYIIDEDGNLALRDRSQNDVYFYVEPVSGSSDTLRITVRRLEQSHVENCDYPVFYNIETGETQDPLANVTELFDYGDVSIAQISPSMRWALVQTFSYAEQGDSYLLTSVDHYLCNLEAGAMVRLHDLLPIDETWNFYPSEMDQTNAFWGSDDTLYVWLYEQTEEDVLSEDDKVWLAAYDPEERMLRYAKRWINSTSVIYTESRDYIGDYGVFYNYNNKPEIGILITDAQDGSQWRIKDIFLSGRSDEVPNQMAFVGTDDKVYLVDEVEKTYVCLDDYLSMPEEEIDCIQMQAENFLCIYTARDCYCYAIPDKLPSEPLIQVEVS